MTFEEIRDLAAEHGIECEPAKTVVADEDGAEIVTEHPRYCRLIMPSYSKPEWCQFKMRDDEPVRMMPPLLLSTAEDILKGMIA
jgi:hypothetical protein